MVKQAARTFAITLAALGISVVPACADGILEQMQNEVAAVAGRARACIVSIEDARVLAVSYANSSLEKADLQNQLAHLLIDEKAAQTQAAQQEQRYKAGLITLLDVEKPRREAARLDTRLTYLQQTLANFGREDAAAQQKRELDARIAELQGDLKFHADQVRLLQQQVAAGVGQTSDLQAAQQQLAHTEQDLNVARQRRKEGTQDVAQTLFFQWDNMRVNTPKSGSGFSIGNGYIVTTADVVQGMSSPIVTIDDGRRIRAALVAIDNERNIGLVRLTANVALPALTFGDSSQVQPGHFAISIGNQSGQYNSVSLGVVSGVRTQGFYSGSHFYPDLLQVDGTVGAGTSGAPILNAKGEVIGMVAAVLAPEPTPAPNSGYVDTTFVTPANLGAQYVPAVPPTPANRAGNAPVLQSPNALPPTKAIPRTPQNAVPQGTAQATAPLPKGNAVMSRVEVFPNQRLPLTANATPAQRAAGNRLQPGNNVPPTRAKSADAGVFVSSVNLSPPALDRRVTAQRPLTIVETAGFAIPANTLKVVIEELKAGKDIVHAWLGIALDDVDDVREENGIIRLNRQARIRGVYANSPAAKMGMKPGDVIVSLDGKPVHTTSEVRAAILPMKAGQTVTTFAQRDGKPVTLNLTLEIQPTPRPSLLTSPVPQSQTPPTRNANQAPNVR